MKRAIKCGLWALLAIFLLAASAFASSYAVKDGHLVRIEADGSESHGDDVHEIALEEASGPKAVRFWALVDESEKPADGKGTGVRFFGADGKPLAFLPLKSVSECQGLFFNPGGDWLAVAKGSGARDDVEFSILAFPSMQAKRVFNGVKWQILWIDSHRFIFTRIGEYVRKGGVFPGLDHGLRLSAVIYDAASDKFVVLKEPTSTQNFMFSLLNTEKNVIQLTEQFVKSANDWGDTGKIQEREITIPIPAAN